MALFPFDATTGRSDWSTIFADPLECAQHLWGLEPSDLVDYDNDDLDELCELARMDLVVYDGLLAWAKERSILSEYAKARLCEVFVLSKKTRSDKSDASYRNNKLRMIAGILKRDYGLLPTANESTRDGQSAADVLILLDADFGKLDKVRSMEEVLTIRTGK
jgi:hypothetical protein